VTAYRFISYETVDDGTIARIMLNRPESWNAQNRGLLVELDEAFLEAERDDQVRVVMPPISAGGVAFARVRLWNR
jgi:enoyl-CoA hydratase